MFWFFIILVFVLAAVAAFFLLNPSSSQSVGPDDAKPGTFEVSTATEDRLIPLVMGTHKVHPNLIHLGRVSHKPIIKVTEVPSDSKGGTEEVEQVVGFSMFLSFLHALADGIGGQALTGFYFNDALVWEGRLTDNQTASVKTGQSALGDNSSGLSRSTVRFRDGSQTSFSEYTAGLGGNVPYYGTSLVYFGGAFIGDNVGTLPNYAFRLESLFDLVDPGNPATPYKIADPATGLIGINPADAILYIVSKLLEIPTNQIDLDSYKAAQATLVSEGFALFVQYDTATSAKDILKDLLRHVDGVHYLSDTTGLWTLDLIRGDYDEGTLVELNNDHIRDLEIDRQGWEDLPTELEIKYLDLSRWELTSLPVENPAAKFAVGASKKKSASFPFIATEAAVQLITARVKKRYYRPLATVRFSLPENLKHPTTGDYWLPNPGDVVKVSYTDPKGKLSFSGMVVRILGKGQGGSESRVSYEGTEDVFADSDVDLTDIPDAPGSGPSYVLSSAPSDVFVGDANPELASRASVIIAATAPPVGLATTFHVKVEDRYDYEGNYELAEVALLREAFGPSVFLEDSIGLTPSGSSSVTPFSQSSGAWQRNARPALITNGSDWELISVRSLAEDGASPGDWIMTGLIRDLAGSGLKLDGTGYKTFPIGSKVFFLQSQRYRSIIPINGALTLSKSFKVSARNHFDVSPESEVFHTYGFTIETPYPVWLLTALIVGSGPTQSHVLSWRTRTRHGGALQGNADNNIIYDRESEGQWEISIPADGSFTPVFVDVPTYTRENAGTSEVTYRVRSFLNGRFSEPRDVTLNA